MHGDSRMTDIRNGSQSSHDLESLLDQNQEYLVIQLHRRIEDYENSENSFSAI